MSFGRYVVASALVLPYEVVRFWPRQQSVRFSVRKCRTNLCQHLFSKPQRSANARLKVSDVESVSDLVQRIVQDRQFILFHAYGIGHVGHPENLHSIPFVRS